MDDTTQLKQKVQNMDDVPFDKDRYAYLISSCEMRDIEALALLLREAGYSWSGISNILGCSSGTVDTYMTKIIDEYGLDAIESHPKSNPSEELWADDYENPFESS